MGKKILIVEDEVPLLNAMTIKLNKEGYEVLQARDGKEGYDIAVAGKPDLIISDILMPNMDGIEMLKMIRDQDWGVSMPIILLTNFNDATHVQSALENQVFDYLVKSNWKLQDLVDKVRATIG